MTAGRLVVVGLGPAGADLLLPVARRALTGAARRFVRTSRHPAVGDLAAEGVTFESFDGLYDSAASIDAVYEAIAGRLAAELDRAAGADVVYAVPGSPMVGERSVVLLRRLLGGRLHVVPGLSFVDLAWTRLAVDPTGGAHVADGQALPSALPAGPLLIGHCHSRHVLSDVKLALLERLDGDRPVTVLQRLGLPDESVRDVPLGELDRAVDADHLTSVYVADLPPGGPGEAWGRLVALIERLRAPGGCPWDAEQTHHSLARHLIEEAYEVIEAIEALPPCAPGGPEPVAEGAYEALEDELGDLVIQVVLHATFAREAGAFTVSDVLNRVHDKMVRRHPHVFGDVEAASAEAVTANWEQIKKAEKGSESLMDSVSGGLPSLLYTHKLYRKAASAGMDWGSAGEVAAGATAELQALAERLDAAGSQPVAADKAARIDLAAEAEARLGEVLGAAVYLARLAGADAESAMRAWAARFRERFQAMERLAASRGVALEGLDPGQRVVLWEEAAATLG